MSDSCDPMDWNLPNSSVHGILQARILEWVAISFSRGSFWPRDWTQVSCTAGRLLIWAKSILEIVKDRGAWRAAVHGVPRSQTGLRDWTTANEKAEVKEWCNLPKVTLLGHTRDTRLWRSCCLLLRGWHFRPVAASVYPISEFPGFCTNSCSFALISLNWAANVSWFISPPMWRGQIWCGPYKDLVARSPGSVGWVINDDPYHGSHHWGTEDPHPCCGLSLFLNLLIFNWSIIALQYCADFCHASAWISHWHTYVPSLLNLPPTSYPTPTPELCQSPVWAPRIIFAVVS